jgi:hypothetical protein
MQVGLILLSGAALLLLPARHFYCPSIFQSLRRHRETVTVSLGATLFCFLSQGHSVQGIPVDYFHPRKNLDAPETDFLGKKMATIVVLLCRMCQRTTALLL